MVDTHAASFISLNYVGVSQVTFTSFGGTQSHSVAGTGTQFVMDNVQLNGPTAVPEPSTYGLAAAALVVGIAAVKRRRSLAART